MVKNKLKYLHIRFKASPSIIVLGKQCFITTRKGNLMNKKLKMLNKTVV
jgi:hypothetical protein